LLFLHKHLPTASDKTIPTIQSIYHNMQPLISFFIGKYYLNHATMHVRNDKPINICFSVSQYIYIYMSMLDGHCLLPLCKTFKSHLVIFPLSFLLFSTSVYCLYVKKSCYTWVIKICWQISPIIAYYNN